MNLTRNVLNEALERVRNGDEIDIVPYPRGGRVLVATYPVDLNIPAASSWRQPKRQIITNSPIVLKRSGCSLG